MWYTTKNGKRVNTDWFEKDAQIAKNRQAAQVVTQPTSFRWSEMQRKEEEKIRDANNEHVIYLDKDGKVLLTHEGDEDSVTPDNLEFNHKIEQAVWDDKEVHTTHNHICDTIFSPSDIDSFCDLENKSISAIIPSGYNVKAYRLVREQPRSSGIMDIDMTTGEMFERKNWTSKYEPKMLKVDYYNQYARVWDTVEKQIDGIEGEYKKGVITRAEYRKKVYQYDKIINDTMGQWLKKNAADYGFAFIEE